MSALVRIPSPFHINEVAIAFGMSEAKIWQVVGRSGWTGRMLGIRLPETKTLIPLLPISLFTNPKELPYLPLQNLRPQEGNHLPGEDIAKNMPKSGESREKSDYTFSGKKSFLF